MKKSDHKPSPELLKLIKMASLRDYKGALNYSKEIFQDHTNNPLFLNALGIIYRRLDDYRQARVFSTKALRLDKELVQAKLNIANIDIEEGYIDRAIHSLKSILEKNKTIPKMTTHMHLRESEYDRAVKYYKEAQSY